MAAGAEDMHTSDTRFGKCPNMMLSGDSPDTMYYGEQKTPFCSGIGGQNAPTARPAEPSSFSDPNSTNIRVSPG